MSAIAQSNVAASRDDASPAAAVGGISVVIPTYNSAGLLRPLLERLVPALRALADAYEIILVNDGSRDDTWRHVEKLAGEYEQVVGIDLARNYGQHSAVLCGVRAARFDVLVTMDDDLQHPPEEIPKLLARLNEGYDVVYGTPAERQHGMWRNLASKITRLTLYSTVGVKTARDVSAFRAFRTRLREAFAGYCAPFVSIDVLMTWGTTQFASVEVRHAPRPLGTSNYTFKKLMFHALNMLTGFSTLPLQISSVMGFAMTALGLVLFAFVLVRFIIVGGSVPGLPFLASVIAIFSGAQMFALGVIGEYLARVHLAVMTRPSFTVRQRIDRRAK